jgi:hypothetical protein
MEEVSMDLTHLMNPTVIALAVVGMVVVVEP